MKWTTDKPTKPGWYWWKETTEGFSPMIVRVVIIDSELEVHSTIRATDRVVLSQFKDGANHWAGPIEEPTE